MSMQPVLSDVIICRTPIPSIRAYPTTVPACPEACPPAFALECDDPIEQVVRELCRMNRTRTLSLLLDVGGLVVERLFGGDVSQIRSRGRKDKSLRKLAAHPKLPFSAATLWRAISIYELVRRFPGLVQSKTLGASHLRAVLSLPPSVQEKLLRAAELDKWSSERLERTAVEYRRNAKFRGGRPPIPPVVKAACQLERIVDTAPIPDNASLAALNARDKQSLKAALESLREWCETVGRQLDSEEQPLAAANS